jgi:phosphopantothenoylcysteine decarboxylase/phosphopantothenate--cysteine ligase
MTSITLIISGSIAAVKAPALITLLRKNKIDVHCIVTRGGLEFVDVKEIQRLSGHDVSTDIFSPKEKKEMWHIRFSRETDLVVIAPATADIIAKMVHGMADDMATATLLANNKKLLVAPAMNTQMWLHPATQRNIAQLKADGAHIIEPGVGMLACGEEGPGRMAEPEEIVAQVKALLSTRHSPLATFSALVTSGPTHEPIDPGRYIANRSSGKQGHAVARALAQAGAQVTLISGPTQLADPAGVKMVRVQTAQEMFDAVKKTLPVDVAVFAAAVGDWHVSESKQKIKKQAGKTPKLALEENPDILASVARHKTKRPKLVVGFAAETEKLSQHAAEKHARKGADWVLANEVAGGKVFGEEYNKIMFFGVGKPQRWPRMSKDEVAQKLVERIIASLNK